MQRARQLKAGVARPAEASRIWPYLVVVSAFFVLAARLPRECFHSRSFSRVAATCLSDLPYAHWMSRSFSVVAIRLGPTWVKSLPKMADEVCQRTPVSAATNSNRGASITTTQAPPPLEDAQEQVKPAVSQQDPPFRSVPTSVSRPEPALASIPAELPNEPLTVPLPDAAVAVSPAPASPLPAKKTRADKTPPEWPVGGPIGQLQAGLQPWIQTGELWAVEVGDLLEKLSALPCAATPETRLMLEQLSRRVARESDASTAIERGPARTKIQHAIFRQVKVWNLLLPTLAMNQTASDVKAADVDESLNTIRRTGQQVRVFLESQTAGLTWSEYLEINKIANIEADTLESQEFVRKILRRIHQGTLNESQRSWMQRPPLRDLHDALRQYNARSLRSEDVLRSVYAFEAKQNSQQGEELARIIDRLLLSDADEIQQIGAVLEELYCGPNVRLSVSEVLMNRLLPGVQWRKEPVRDNVLGADVRGDSLSSTQLRVDVLPQRNGIRLLLEATGDVQSDTRARKWPVVLENRGHANFVARKEIFFDSHGLRMEAAQVGAQGTNRLKSISSEFDSIPLVGWMVRQLAKEEHEQQSLFIQNRMKSKISTQARQRMDAELSEKSGDIQEKLNQLVVAPVRRLDLNPKIYELESTDDRISFSCRLAAPCQVGSHTVRPLALRNSLMSLQVNESVFNNLFSQLQLAGWQGELPDFLDHIAERLGTEKTGHKRRAELKEEFPEGIFLALDATCPVRVVCHDEQLELRIHFAKLHVSDHEWRDFVVRGFYRPNLEQNNADLVRDGVIRLSGRKLGIGDHVALRAIFTKVLSKDDRWPVFSQAWLRRETDPQVRVNQFVVQDGWLGISVSDGKPHQELPPVWMAKPPQPNRHEPRR
ncbi:MAG: hypothetical protein O2931_00190 [Planctomycetota bacterium]|nr:hypothetical protein [Planctomycetota bacterium]